MSTERAVDVLISEHRAIDRVSAVLERIADDAAFRGQFDGDRAEDVLVFLRVFLERIHLAKEEQCLYPLLVARGVAEEEGSVSALKIEHDRMRAHVRALAAAIHGARAGDVEDREQFASRARALVELLAVHDAKEDRVLFPRVNAALNSADDASLLACFAAIDEDDVGAGVKKAMLEFAEAAPRRASNHDAKHAAGAA